jgi:hypothetical protein
MSESEGHLGTRDVFRWIPHGAERKAQLLAELYPYLIVKRQQALLAWNMLQFVSDGKRLGRGEHGPAVREKRDHLARLLGDANAGRAVDVPSWCAEPPSMFEPGWYLRSDIIWAKKNCMPESVTDRPTRSHEYIFLLSKSARYYYDAEAIKEAASESSGAQAWRRIFDPAKQAKKSETHGEGAHLGRGDNRHGDNRNKRSVWHIATQPYPEAHFATFPEALIEPCILAGTSEKGCCPRCYKPWVRVVEHVAGVSENAGRPKQTAGMGRSKSTLSLSGNGSKEWAERGGKTITTGWEPSCACAAGDPIPCTVLDPFNGSGTTGAVAIRHQRNYVGIELNQAYIELARKRIGAVAPLFSSEVA